MTAAFDATESLADIFPGWNELFIFLLQVLRRTS
jgi:hypothetical protein